MLNILYENYPTSIIVDKVSYPIVTDFRNWIAFFDMFNDDALTKEDIVISSLNWFTDTIPKDINKACNGLIAFARADDINPKLAKNSSSETQSNKQILSYLYDCEYILGAFLQVYHIDLNNIEYMHWYKFCALFDAVPEDTPLKKRMGYRSVNVSSIKDKSERKRIKAIQREIALPQRVLTASEIGNRFG